MNPIIIPSQCELGEGPIWHARTSTYYWVDINKGLLYAFHSPSQDLRSWHFSGHVTFVLETVSDALLLALDTKILRFDPKTEKSAQLTDLEPQLKHQRCNDGKVDSLGRVWAGTTHNDHDFEKGTLYLLDKNLKQEKKIEKVTISNGLIWSNDDTQFYFIDSPTQQVKVYDYDAASGNITHGRVAVNIPKHMGTPDGMTIDSEGMLWIAHWGGFGVYRWNPHTGEMLAKIEIPAPHVTSCAFGGEDLDHLIITTARKGMTSDDLLTYPESGNTFMLKPGVKGVKANRAFL